MVAVAISYLRNFSFTRAALFSSSSTRWKFARFRGGQILNPYPPHYRAAFAFSIILYPHLHQLTLRLTFPFRARYGLTTFP